MINSNYNPNVKFTVICITKAKIRHKNHVRIRINDKNLNQ